MKKSQFLLLCFLPFIGLAQASDAGEYSRNLEDRYIHLYDKLVEHQYADLDSASHYADQLLALSKENQDSMWIAAALEGQGYVHYYREEVDQALEKFQLQKKIMLSVAMPGELGLAYMNIANVQSGIGESNKSILNYLEAQKLLPKDSTYDIDRAYLYYNLANNLVEFEDYRSAADYLKRAKDYALQEKITDLIPSIINIEAELSLTNDLPNQALKLADSALVQSREVNDMIEELYALELMARAHSMNGNHDKAILLQKESLRLTKLYGDPYLENFAQAVMADIYLQAGQVDKALPLAREAYENREAQNRISAKKEAARVYARALELVDQPAKALQVMKQYLDYKDIIHHTSLSETLLEAQNSVIANSNQLLEEKAALQSEIINRNKTLQYILIGSLLLAIIGIALIVINVRNKNKANRRLKYQRLLLNQKSRELAEVNNKLEKLNQGKDKLFSILTHDIKQPFNQTLGALELLEVNTVEDESVKELILEVRQSVESDKKTVENLLIWSKSQFASISAKPQKVQFQRVGGQVLDDLNQSILEKGLKLQTYFDHNASAFVDPYHLEIIMRNLLTNAVKFSPKGGSIQVADKILNGMVELSIKDNGVGMTESQIARLFDQNQHFSERGTLNEVGTGLGMLIVFDFVKENNGEILVNSEPGKGSEFIIRFPSAE